MTTIYQDKIERAINDFVFINKLVMEQSMWKFLTFIGDDFYLDGKLTQVKYPSNILDICGGESLSVWVEFGELSIVKRMQSIRVVTKKLEEHERIALSTEPVLLFSDASGTATYRLKKPKRKKLLKKIDEMQIVIDTLMLCKSMIWERKLTEEESGLLYKYIKE
jgi:hypothetical protein